MYCHGDYIKHTHIVTLYVSQMFYLNYIVYSLRLVPTTNTCHVNIEFHTMIGIPYLSQLFNKVIMKCHEEMQHRNSAQTVVELCAIRDGVADCDTLSYNNVCNLIDLISLD